jgi:hypothetical protein
MNIKETKDKYERLVWICVRAEKTIPKHYNEILDLIEIIENANCDLSEQEKKK